MGNTSCLYSASFNFLFWRVYCSSLASSANYCCIFLRKANSMSFSCCSWSCLNSLACLSHFIISSLSSLFFLLRSSSFFCCNSSYSSLYSSFLSSSRALCCSVFRSVSSLSLRKMTSLALSISTFFSFWWLA